jgi:hypothetical protein
LVFSDCNLLHFSGLNRNNIDGTIPACIGTLRFLSEVNFDSTLLTGPIPDIMTTLPLTEVRIRKTGITGTIPVGFANITGLQILAISGDGIEGAIPPFCQNGTGHALTTLILSRTRLNGTVPQSLARCAKLASIALRENMLVCHSSGFIDLSRATDCTLDHNLFSGPTSPFDRPPCADLFPAKCTTGPSRVIGNSVAMTDTVRVPYGNLTFVMNHQYPSITIELTGTDFFTRINVTEFGEFFSAKKPPTLNFVPLNASVNTSSLVWTVTSTDITIGGDPFQYFLYEVRQCLSSKFVGGVRCV